jgi:hypothetical protein
MGGRPADKCKSDALFLTEKANNSEISIKISGKVVDKKQLNTGTVAQLLAFLK